MRLIVGACACFLWLAPLVALSAPNEDVRIVLHGHPQDPLNTCTTPQDSLGLDCDGIRPIVSVPAGAAIDVYVYLQNYDTVCGAQMAFEWDASWTMLYWIGSCQSSEVLGSNAPQASGDSYVGAFDAITGGALAPLGRMRFTAGDTGTEFAVIETWAPGGTGLIDDVGVFSTIPPQNRGVVAVESPGVDSCGGESKSRAFF